MIHFHSLKVQKKVDSLLLKTWGVSEWSKKSLAAIISWDALWGQHTLHFRLHAWPRWGPGTRFPETSYTTAGGSLRQPILCSPSSPKRICSYLPSTLHLHSFQMLSSFPDWVLKTQNRGFLLNVLFYVYKMTPQGKEREEIEHEKETEM